MYRNGERGATPCKRGEEATHGAVEAARHQPFAIRTPADGIHLVFVPVQHQEAHGGAKVLCDRRSEETGTKKPPSAVIRQWRLTIANGIT